MAGLHAISDDGMIYWHCDNPDCEYHNCFHWHDDEKCIHHRAYPAKKVGKTLQAHVSHHDMQWSAHAEQMIHLPVCPCCGWFKSIRVPTEEECKPARVIRDQAGAITSVEIDDNHPAPNLIIIEQRLEQIPPDEERLKAIARSLHDARTPREEQYLLQDLRQTARPTHKLVIVDVRPHPAIALHRSLASLLKANGKIPSVSSFLDERR